MRFISILFFYRKSDLSPNPKSEIRSKFEMIEARMHIGIPINFNSRHERHEGRPKRPFANYDFHPPPPFKTSLDRSILFKFQSVRPNVQTTNQLELPRRKLSGFSLKTRTSLSKKKCLIRPGQIK